MIFRDFKPYDADFAAAARATTIDVAAHHQRMLDRTTERWLRKAIEAGAGWNVWRSHPRSDDGDLFVIKYEFQLVQEGQKLGAGIVYVQPDLTPGERVRLLDGRHDWREDKWEDECGVLDCGHPCCERARL